MDLPMKGSGDESPKEFKAVGFVGEIPNTSSPARSSAASSPAQSPRSEVISPNASEGVISAPGSPTQQSDGFISPPASSVNSSPVNSPTQSSAFSGSPPPAQASAFNDAPKYGAGGSSPSASSDAGEETAPQYAQPIVPLLPNFKPIRVSDFFLLAFFVAIPTVSYIIGFTKIGYGVTVYTKLKDRFEEHADVLGISLLVVCFVLYVLDIHYWQKPYRKVIRKILYTLITISFIALVLAVAGSVPYAPISIYLIVTTMWMIFMQRVCYPKIETNNFVSWLGSPFFTVGTISFLYWLVWTFLADENEWTRAIKMIDSLTVSCIPDFENREDCMGDEEGEVCFEVEEAEDGEEPTEVKWEGEDCNAQVCSQVFANCSIPFIIWVGPFLVSVGLLFLSFFTTMVREKTSTEQEMMRFAKVWCIVVFGMWVSASLAGAGSDVTFTIAALTFSGFIASGIFLKAIYSRVEREEQLNRLFGKLQDKYANYMHIARGLVFLLFSPFFLAYFIVSSLKQKIRQMKCFHVEAAPMNTKSVMHINAGNWLTVEARRMLRDFYQWKRAKVYTWSIYWGLIFISISVLASKFTVLFLSWLITKTQDMSLGVVTAIMVGVGLIMFLLPPVPGAPIYLTVGIVIIPVGKDTIGIPWGITFAVVVSLALKLLATLVQQKGIGTLLKNNVNVRKAVGVNSKVMRSFKLLLSAPGLNMAKIAILCGGPDWPTSVFCGIIDLPVIPILIGTIPCLILILPTVLTGSFTYMAGMTDDEGVAEYPWASSAASVCSALTALVLFGMMILAAGYVEETLNSRQDEVEALPYDMEVMELEKEEEAFNNAFDEVTDWVNVPMPPRITLFTGAILMVFSVYMVFCFSCFRNFGLTDTIENELDGKWTNLVRLPGGIALILFTLSLLLLFAFNIWAKKQARELLKRKIESSDSDSTYTAPKEVKASP